MREAGLMNICIKDLRSGAFESRESAECFLERTLVFSNLDTELLG